MPLFLTSSVSVVGIGFGGLWRFAGPFTKVLGMSPDHSSCFYFVILVYLFISLTFVSVFRGKSFCLLFNPE